MSVGFLLELRKAASYRRGMKRISLVLMTLALWAPPVLRAQDAALEERLNKLSGQIEDLRAARETDQKRIAELTKDLEAVREQAAKPTGNYASQEDLRRLAEKLQEVDKNREHDKDIILKEISKLGKVVAVPPPPKKAPQSAPADNPVPGPGTEKSAMPEKGFEYVIKSGDTLSVIVQAYKDQNIKVTVDQILKANPGLKPEKLRVGQKIFIPAPQ